MFYWTLVEISSAGISYFPDICDQIMKFKKEFYKVLDQGVLDL